MEYQLQLFKKLRAMWKVESDNEINRIFKKLWATWKVISDNEINLSSGGSIMNNFVMLT